MYNLLRDNEYLDKVAQNPSVCQLNNICKSYTKGSCKVNALNNVCLTVKKGDYIFMGAYSLQAGYGVGRGEAFSYIYSKDCNRDVEI